MKQVRKAAAAFVASIVTVPAAAWLAGTEPFTWQAVGAALAAAAVNALSVWAAPRNDYSDEVL